MKRWFAWAFLAFALHFMWEMGQARWYASMQGLPFWTATLLCLRAAAADLGIIAAVYLATAVLFRDIRWITGSRWLLSSVVFLLLGLAITATIELWATSRGRWAYAPENVTIGSRIGLLPLLQWTIIPGAIVALVQLDRRGHRR